MAFLVMSDDLTMSDDNLIQIDETKIRDNKLSRLVEPCDFVSLFVLSLLL